MPLIRPARPGDLPELLGLVQALARHHRDTPTASEASLRRDLFSLLPWALALVAEGPTGLLGYTVLTRGVQLQSGGRTMDMHHLYVRPEGRGQGIGRALVQAALAHARAEGCIWMTVGTAPQNPEAARFYPAMGFTTNSPEGQRFRANLSGDAT